MKEEHVLNRLVTTLHMFNSSSNNLNKYRKNWTCKGMISKHVLPLNGLTNLVVGCTIDGVTNVLLLVPISTYMKLSGSYLKSRKAIWYICNSNW